MPLDAVCDRLKGGEVLIVGGLAAGELPDAFGRIEFGAVGRQELQREAGLGLFAPPLVDAAMVIGGIVEEDSDPAAGVRADLPQLLEAERAG